MAAANPAHQLALLLSALLSPDNAERRAAEAQFAALRQAPGAAEQLPLALLGFVRAAEREAGQRQLAAVLLWRVLIKGAAPLWHRASPAVRAALKQGLIEALAAEPLPLLRRALCDVAAQVASAEFEDADNGTGSADERSRRVVAAWPELWRSIHEGATAAAPHGAQEASLLLLERLGHYVGDHMHANFAQLRAVFLNRMADTTVPLVSVRVAAARAAAALFINVQPSEAGAFVELLPAMLRLLGEAASTAAASNPAASTAALNVVGALNDICVEHAAVFKPLLRDAVMLLCSLAANGAFEYELRSICLDSVVTLAEKAPALARRLMPADFYLHQVLPVLFGMLLAHGDVVDGSDDENLAAWEAGAGLLAGGGTDADEDDERDGEGRFVDLAQETMQRVGAAIGAKRFLPIVDAIVVPLLDNAAWRERLAGLLALDECAGLEPPSDGSDLQRLAVTARQLGLAAVRDPHARCRNAAFMALCSTATFHAPLFAQQQHAVIMPAIVAGLRDSSLRVRTSACLALSGLTDQLDADTDTDAAAIAPYLEHLLRALVENVGRAGPNDGVLRMRALSALSQLAGAAGTAIAPFYDMLVGGLLALLNAPEPAATGAGASAATGGAAADQGRSERAAAAALRHARLLKGKSLECLTLVGSAAGADRFRTHAVPTLVGIVGILTGLAAGRGQGAAGLAADDPVQSYCWDAVGRLAKVLDAAEFAPFVPLLVPALLNGARQEGFVTVTAEVDEEEDAGTGDDDDDKGNVSSGGGTRRGAVEGAGGDGTAAGGGDDHEDVDRERRGDGQVVNVRSSELEDKQSALDALANLFHVLRGSPALVPFASPLLETALHTLRHPAMQVTLFRGVREACLVLLEDVFFALAGAVSGADAEAAAGADEAALAASLAAADGGPPAAQYLSMLHAAIAALWAQLEWRADLQGEGDDGDDDGCQSQYIGTVLLALKKTLEHACGRAFFADGAASPTATAPAPAAVPAPGAALAAEGLLLGGPGRSALLFRPLLRDAQLEQLAARLLQVRQGAVQRRSVRAAERAVAVSAGDLDEEALEQLQERDETDEQVMVSAVDVLGVLFKTHGARFAPAFSRVAAAQLETWADGRCLPFDRLCAVLLVDDVLEFGGDAALDARDPAAAAAGRSLADRYLPLLIAEASPAADENIKRAAVYGLGAAAAPSARALARTLPAVLEMLTRVVEATAQRPTDAHDNAVSAIAKIMLVHVQFAGDSPASAPAAPASPRLARSALMALVLSRLPLRIDLAENVPVALALCGWLRARDPDLCGPSPERANAPLLAAAVAALAFAVDEARVSAAGAGAAVPAMRAEAATALRDLQSWLPAPALAALWAGLGAEQQQALGAVLAAHVPR